MSDVVTRTHTAAASPSNGFDPVNSSTVKGSAESAIFRCCTTSSGGSPGPGVTANVYTTGSSREAGGRSSTVTVHSAFVIEQLTSTSPVSTVNDSLPGAAGACSSAATVVYASSSASGSGHGPSALMHPRSSTACPLVGVGVTATSAC
jgi:hypothetical protein